MSIAVVPGYAVIGIAAPLLVVAGRLLQGFSAGVELGGVSVYLSEIATPGHKGFYVAWQSASQQCAVVFAALIGVALSSSLTKAQMEAFGWRIPLLVGCGIIPFLFLLRRSLTETDVFLARKRHPSTGEIMASLRANWKLVAQGTMLVTMTTVSFYMITTYTPTFGRSVLHLSDRESLMVTLCVGISNFIWLPLAGALSDRIGRTPILVFATLLGILTAYPALAWAVASPSFSRLLVVELWLSFVYGSYNGAMVVYLTEIMPPQVRASGFSLAYSLATALFGGFTPYISTWLIGRTHNSAIPGAWVMFACAAGLVATLLLRQKKAEFVDAPEPDLPIPGNGWSARAAREPR